MIKIFFDAKIKITNCIKVFCIILLLPSIFFSSIVNAQTAKPKIGTSSTSEIYRYTQNGTVVYGDKIPNSTNVKVEAISKKTGVTIETKRFSDEELDEQKKLKEEEIARKILKEKEDSVSREILSRYSSLKDIEDRKKYELSKISEIIQKDITTQVTLEEQKSTLDREIKRNPENKKRLEIEYRTIEKDLEKVKENLELNKGIYFDRSSQFDRDKEVYLRIIENSKPKK